MHVMDYVWKIERADRNEALMCRIVLNTMVDSRRFPLSIVELRTLSPENRAFTTSFLEWAFSHDRSFTLGDHVIEAMINISTRLGERMGI